MHSEATEEGNQESPKNTDLNLTVCVQYYGVLYPASHVYGMSNEREEEEEEEDKEEKEKREMREEE